MRSMEVPDDADFLQLNRSRFVLFSNHIQTQYVPLRMREPSSPLTSTVRRWVIPSPDSST